MKAKTKKAKKQWPKLGYLKRDNRLSALQGINQSPLLGVR